MLSNRIRPNIETTPASAPEGKALWDSVYKTLRNYRMTMMVTSDGDGYPLIDAMSPEQGTIEIGIEECTYLADAIYNDLLAAAPTPPVSEDRKDAERFRFMLDDHAEKTTRQRVRELFERLPVMSLSAARVAIDAAMQEDKQ